VMGARWIERVHRVAQWVRREGWRFAARQVWRRLRHGPSAARGADVIGHYRFVLPHTRPASAPPAAAAPGTILWFIPDFNIGSGGHLNIFRTIWHLEQRGFESRIVIVEPAQHADAASAAEDIQRHFLALRAPVHLGLEGLPPCEFAVATAWNTAYVVRNFSGARYRVYFVQDFEPYFYPMGTEWVLAENTYRMGFFGITAGGWLAQRLAQDYGMRTRAVGFGVELQRYRRLPRREPDQRRVFFYARPPTPRRAFELGLLVLHEVWRCLPQTHFILAGWDTSGYEIPFPHLSAGTVALDDLPDLYSQCDVALVLSLTNLSLLPLELMACGCTVVSNRGANVEWLLNDEVAALADATPEALTDAICQLLKDDERRQALSRRAEAFARTQTWEAVADGFERALQAVRAQAIGAEHPCAA